MNDVANPQARMRAYLQIVATGPELSRSLTQAQAEDAMLMILNDEIDAVRAGIFLIALRMKRESDGENIGVLNALLKKTQTHQTKSPEILALAEPFNGCLRGLSAAPFLPAVFAACGLPTYNHGLESVAPKYGITTRRVLAAAGKNVDHDLANCAACLDNTELGWCYVDQKHYLPSLHNLVELRDKMVKRSCLSTIEVVLRPLYGNRSTHLLTGFVHKVYPPIYAMLAKHCGFDSAMIVRGVEGGCIPSLSQPSRYFSYRGEQAIQLHRLAPRQLGIRQTARMVAIPKHFAAVMKQTDFQSPLLLDGVVAHNLECGLSALANKPGAMYDSLIYGVAIGIRHIGLAASLADGAQQARTAIASGAALARFQAG